MDWDTLKAVTAKDILCAYLTTPENQHFPYGYFVDVAIKEAEILIDRLKNGQD